jgi:hypothetical protein
VRARRGEAPGTPGSELDLSLADECKSWVLIGQSIRRVLRARRGEAPGTPGSELDLSLADECRVLDSDWSIH